MPHHQMHDSDVTEAINNCLACSRSCMEVFQYCLDEKGTAFSGKMLSLLQVCVDSCQLNARLLMAESPFYHQASELCFEVCRACAVECDRYEYDDIFKVAALNLRRCEDSCRRMTGLTTRVSAEEITRASGVHQ